MFDINIQDLPNEVLLCIFTFVDPKSLVISRLVSSRWRQCVDKFTSNETLWRGHCRRDFPDVWESAHMKAFPGVTWYHLYRSLTLWPKIHEARTIRKDIPIETFNPDDKIIDFQVASHGVVSIYTKKTVMYYDLSTYDVIMRANLPKQCLGSNAYIIRQNREIVVFNTECNILYVSWITLNTTTEHVGVKLFLLLESSIYFVTVEDNIFLCQIENGQVMETMWAEVPEGVKLISCQDSNIYILSSADVVYLFANNKLTYVTHFTNQDIIMESLTRYNFLNLNITTTALATALELHGILYTYDSVMFTSDIAQLDIDLKKKPVQYKKQPYILYSYMDPHNPVINIDVVEGKDSHILIAATSNKLVTVQFKHY